ALTPTFQVCGNEQYWKYPPLGPFRLRRGDDLPPTESTLGRWEKSSPRDPFLGADIFAVVCFVRVNRTLVYVRRPKCFVHGNFLLYFSGRIPSLADGKPAKR